MQRYNPFRCTCGKGDIILRTSCQLDTLGLQYYACPRSKPGTKNYGCGYFDWKDAFDERLMVSSSSTSEGSSGLTDLNNHNQVILRDLTDQHNHNQALL
ncbi:hypothetical protein Tco_1167667 [Tanacetum coccineum]